MGKLNKTQKNNANVKKKETSKKKRFSRRWNV